MFGHSSSGAGRTANGAALCRFIEQGQPVGWRQFDDPVVETLLDPGLVAMARAGQFRDQLLSALPPGTYGGQVMRTRYIDDVVVNQATAGITQLVVVGAGLDTRAYRLAALAPVVVFEVDLPSVQRRKQKRLAGRRPVAREVRPIPLDLRGHDLAAALSDAGLDAGRRALVVFEGVSQYLPESTNRSILRAVSQCAPGSALVLTYVVRSLMGTWQQRPASGDAGWLGEMLPNIRSTDPWVFGLDPAELPGFLGEFGLTVIDDVGATEYGRRYLEPIGRELAISPVERTALAVV